MIPKTQFLNPFSGEKLFPLGITLLLLRQTVLKAIEFNRQLCGGTKEIEEVFSDDMLSAKLESSKTSRPQRAPQLFFFFGLFPTQSTCIGSLIHEAKRKK